MLATAESDGGGASDGHLLEASDDGLALARLDIDEDDGVVEVGDDVDVAVSVKGEVVEEGGLAGEVADELNLGTLCRETARSYGNAEDGDEGRVGEVQVAIADADSVDANGQLRGLGGSHLRIDKGRSVELAGLQVEVANQAFGRVADQDGGRHAGDLGDAVEELAVLAHGADLLHLDRVAAGVALELDGPAAEAAGDGGGKRRRVAADHDVLLRVAAAGNLGDAVEVLDDGDVDELLEGVGLLGRVLDGVDGRRGGQQRHQEVAVGADGDVLEPRAELELAESL